MFIQTEATPNPQTLKFIPGQPVMKAGVAEFASVGEAKKKSPLAEELFSIDGVKGVFFGSDFISITKSDETEWSDVKTYVLGILFEHFSMQKPVLIENANDDDLPVGEETETTLKIREILDTRVRPAVAKDGGDIVFHSFDKGIVYLKMRGACSGCPSSTMTLKMGIENMLRHYLPEVLEVRAVAD